jgi:putative endonuclease
VFNDMNLRQFVSRWRARLFPKKTLGQRGEAAAARYLRRRGYKVLARGDRFGPGELDLVMLDRRTIVFVEVKTRESADAGHPAEAVDDAKQRRLTRLAVTFLKRHRLLEYPARFDVIAVTWPAGKRRPTIEHFKNAFDAVGKWEMYS